MRTLVWGLLLIWTTSAASSPRFLVSHSIDTLRDGSPSSPPQPQQLSRVAINEEDLAPETRVRLMVAATSGTISTTVSSGVSTSACGDSMSVLFMAHATVADVERVLLSLWFTPSPPLPSDVRCGDRAFRPPRVDLWLDTSNDQSTTLSCADLPQAVSHHLSPLQHHVKRIQLIAPPAMVLTASDTLRVQGGELTMLSGLRLRVPAEDTQCGLAISQQQRYQLTIRTSPEGDSEVRLRPTIQSFLATFVSEFDVSPSASSRSRSIQIEATSDYIRLALRSLTYKAPNDRLDDEIRIEVRPVGPRADESAAQETRLAVLVAPAPVFIQVNWDGASIDALQTIDMDEDTSIALSGLSLTVPKGGVFHELIVNVTVAASHGSLLNEDGGDGDNLSTRRALDSSAIQVSGSLEKINHFVQGLVYVPDHNYNGPDTIVVSVAPNKLNHDWSTMVQSSSEFVRVFLHPIEDGIDLSWTGIQSNLMTISLSAGERRRLPSVTVVDGEESGNTAPFFAYQSFLRSEIETDVLSGVDLHHSVLKPTKVIRGDHETMQLRFEGDAEGLLALLEDVELTMSQRLWSRPTEAIVNVSISRVSAVDGSTSSRVGVQLEVTFGDSQLPLLAPFIPQFLIEVQEDQAIDLGGVFRWDNFVAFDMDANLDQATVGIKVNHGQVASNATFTTAVPRSSINFQALSFGDLKNVLNQLTYTPERNYAGDDELLLSFRNQTVTLWIRVFPSNDPPSIVLVPSEDNSESMPLRAFVPAITVEDADTDDILTLEVTLDDDDYSLVLDDSTSVFAAGLQVEGLHATNWRPGSPITTNIFRVRGSQAAINSVFFFDRSIEVLKPDTSTAEHVSVRVCVSDESLLKSCVNQQVRLPVIDSLIHFPSEAPSVEFNRVLPVSSLLGIEDDALLNQTIVSIRLSARLGAFVTMKPSGVSLPCGQSVERRTVSEEPRSLYLELFGPWGCIHGLVARSAYRRALLESAEPLVDDVRIEVWHAARRLVTRSFALTLLPPTPRFRLSMSIPTAENTTPIAWRWTHGRPALFHQYVAFNITSATPSDFFVDDNLVAAEDQLLVLNVSTSASCLMSFDIESRPAIPSVDYSFAPRQPSHKLQFFGTRRSLKLLLQTLEIRAADASNETGDCGVELSVAEAGTSLYATAIVAAQVTFSFETIEPPLEWQVIQETFESDLGSNVAWIDGVGLAPGGSSFRTVRVAIECASNTPVFVTIHHPAIRLVSHVCGMSSHGESIEVTNTLAMVNDMLRNIEIQRKDSSPSGELVKIRFLAGDDVIDDETSSSMVEVHIQFRPAPLGNLVPLAQQLIPANNSILALDEDSSFPLGAIFLVSEASRDGNQLYRMTVTVSHGTLEVPLSQVCCVNIMTSSTTPRLVVESTLSALRDALAAVLYKPRAEFSGDESLHLSIDCEERDIVAWTHEVAIRVRPVNDPPHIAVYQGPTQAKPTTDGGNSSLTLHQTELSIQLSDADIFDLLNRGIVDNVDRSEPNPSTLHVRLDVLSVMASIVLPRWTRVNDSLLNVTYNPAPFPREAMPRPGHVKSLVFSAPLETANELLSSVLFVSSTSGSREPPDVSDEDGDAVDGELLEVYVSDLGHGLSTWKPAEAVEIVRIRPQSEEPQNDALVLTLPPDHASLDASQRSLTISGLSIAGFVDAVGDATDLDEYDDDSLVRITGTPAFRVVPEVQRVRIVGPDQIQVLSVVMVASGGADVTSVAGAFQLQTRDPVTNQVKSAAVYAQAVAMRVDEVVGNEGTGRGRDESMEACVATLFTTKMHITKTVVANTVMWRMFLTVAAGGSTLPPLQVAGTALTGVGVGSAVAVSTSSDLFGASLSGSFTLGLGHEATRSIRADASALHLQDALEELPSVHVVQVTSVAPYTFDVTFFQPGANIPLLEADVAMLKPIATVSDAAWPTITTLGASINIERVTQGVGQGSVYEVNLDGVHVSPVYQVAVSRGVGTLSGGSFALSFQSDATGSVLVTTDPIAFDAVATVRDEAVLTQEGGRWGNSLEGKLREAIQLLPRRHWATATRLVVSRASTGTPPTFTWIITFVDAPSDFPTLIAATSSAQPVQARLRVVVSVLTPANALGGSFTLSFNGETTPPLSVSAPATAVQASVNALDAVRNASTSFGRVMVRRREIWSVGGASFAVLFVEQAAVSSRAASLFIADGGALTGLGAFASVRAFRHTPWLDGSWVFPGFTSLPAFAAEAAWTRGVEGQFDASSFSLLGAAADVRVWLQLFTYRIPASWCCGFVSIVLRAQRLVGAADVVAVVRTDEQALAYQTPTDIALYTEDAPHLSDDLVVTRGRTDDIDFFRIALPPVALGLLWVHTRARVLYGTLAMQSLTDNSISSSELWLNGSAEAVNASLARMQYQSPRLSEYAADLLSLDVFAASNDQLLTRSELLIRIDEPPFEPRIAQTNGMGSDVELFVSDDATLSLRGISIVDATVAGGLALVSPTLLSDVTVHLRLEAHLGQLNLTRIDGLVVTDVAAGTGVIELHGRVAALNDALAGLTYSCSRVFLHTRDTVTVRVSYQPEDRPPLVDVRTLRIAIQHAIHVPRVAIASSDVATYAAKEDNGYQFPNLTISSQSTSRVSQRRWWVPVAELRRTELTAPLVTTLPITSADVDPRHRWVVDLPGLSLGATAARSFAALSTRRFIFAGTNRTTGEELWSSDGTTNGTQLLADLMPGAASGRPSDFALVPPSNNRVVFAADGVDSSWTLSTDKPCNRERLSSTATDLLYVVASSATWDPTAKYDCPHVGWRWATTDEARARFRDEHGSSTPVSANLSEPYVFWGVCDWNGFVFGGVTRKHFRLADSAVTGALKHAGRRDSAPLEVSFSTADFAGIICIREEDGPSDTHGSAAGRELWITDGSATFGATKRLADIEPGPRGSNPTFLTPFQSRWVVFQATTATIGSELFKTDGTATGTVLVEDIWRGPRSSRPSDFAEWAGGDGRLYFAATTESGRELWSTDGLSSVTVERGRRAAASSAGVLIGTALVRDICTLSGGSSDPQFLTPLGAVGVFFAASDCVNGRELWVTDGTLAGTKMVKDINVASGQGSDPSHLTAFSGKLYFAATANAIAMGRELFVSDGTAAGTQLLVELVPGVASAAPTLLTVANARLYFHAIDAHGVGNLWVSDGTATGTSPVWDAPFAQSHTLRTMSATPSTSTGLNDRFFVLNNALYYFTERRWADQRATRGGDDERADDQDVFSLQITVTHGTISIPPERPIPAQSLFVNGTRQRLEDALRRTLFHPPLNWNVLQSAGDHVVQWNFTVSSSDAAPLRAAETTIADLIVRPQLDPPVIVVLADVEHVTASAHDYLSRLRLECLPLMVLEDVPTPLRGLSVRGVDDLDGSGVATWELELSVARGRLSVPSIVAGCVRIVTYGSLVDTKHVRLVATRVACLSRLLSALSYRSDPNFSGADTLAIRVRVAVGTTIPTAEAEDVAAVPLIITEVNDAPYLAPTPGGFFYDAEEDHALVIRDLNVDDSDAAAGQRVHVDVSVLFGAIKLLAPGASGVSIDSNEAAAWAATSSTRLVFSGSLGDVNAALASVAYTSAPNWNSLAHANEHDGFDVITVALSDGQAFNASTTAQLYMFVAPTPDPVVITPPVVRATSLYSALAHADGALHGDEDEWLEATGLAFTSEDDTTRASLDVTLRVSNGRLAIDETLLRTSGVSIAGSASDGSVWRLRGRFALVNRSVAAIRYLPLRDYYGADALEIVATAIDDYGNQQSIETTRVVAITIHAVNDAPQWILPASRVAWRQDGSTRIAGVGLHDVDAALADCDALQCEWEVVVEVTGSGSLTLPRLEQPPIYTSASNYVALEGTLTELNRALSEIVLTTADLDSVVREPVEVWFTADDRGSLGTGGPQVARQRLVVLPLQRTQHALTLSAPQDVVLMMDEDTALVFNGSITLQDRDASTRPTAAAPQYELTVETRHGRFHVAPSAFSGARLLVVPTGTDRVLRVRGFIPQLNAALNGSTYVPDANWFGTERLDFTAKQFTDGPVDSEDADAMAVGVTMFVSPVCDAPQWRQQPPPSRDSLQADIVLDEDGQALVTSLAIEDPDVLADQEPDDEGGFHRELSVAIDVRDGAGVMLATTRGLHVTDARAPEAWPPQFEATRLLFFSRVVVTGRVAELNAALRGLIYRPRPDFHTSGHVLDAITLRAFAPSGACAADSPLTATMTLRAQIAAVNDAPQVVSPRFQPVDARDIANDAIHSRFAPTQDASTELQQPLDAISLHDADVMVTDAIGEPILRPEATFRVRVSCRSCRVATSTSVETLQKNYGVLTSQDTAPLSAASAAWGGSSIVYYAPIETLNTVVLSSLVFTSASHFAGHAVVLLEVSDLGFFGSPPGKALETAFAMVVRVRRVNVGPQILVPPFGSRAPPLEVDEGASILIQGAPPLQAAKGSSATDGIDDFPTWQLLLVDPRGADSPSRVRSLVDITAIKDPRAAVSSLALLSPSQLVFSAFTGSSGSELWTSDGTASGTQLLKDLSPLASSSEPRFLTRFSVDGRVYFAARGIDADAWRLRPDLRDRCDGARESAFAPGVFFVVAQSTTWDPDETYDCPAGLRWMTTAEAARVFVGTEPTDLGNAHAEPLVYFDQCGWDAFAWGDQQRAHFRFADSRVTGAFKHTGHRDSYRPDVGFQTADFAGIVCRRRYADEDEDDDQASSVSSALWATDGTRDGTHRVTSAVSQLAYLTEFQGRLFFQGTTPDFGAELWATDGSRANTQLVADVAVGTRSSAPDHLTVVGGKLFFSAETEAAGRELWVSDGNSRREFAQVDHAGTATRLVLDIYSGTASSSPRFLTALSSSGLLLFQADDGIHGAELWASDGSAAGTVLVLDICSGPLGSTPRFLTLFNNRIFFQADDSVHGAELWVTDGTSAGTQLLSDLVPGARGAAPRYLSVLQLSTLTSSVLVFAAASDRDASVVEFWTSDGSSMGTQKLFAGSREVVVVNDAAMDDDARTSDAAKRLQPLGGCGFVVVGRSLAIPSKRTDSARVVVSRSLTLVDDDDNESEDSNTITTYSMTLRSERGGLVRLPHRHNCDDQHDTRAKVQVPADEPAQEVTLRGTLSTLNCLVAQIVYVAPTRGGDTKESVLDGWDDAVVATLSEAPSEQQAAFSTTQRVRVRVVARNRPPVVEMPARVFTPLDAWTQLPAIHVRDDDAGATARLLLRVAVQRGRVRLADVDAVRGAMVLTALDPRGTAVLELAASLSDLKALLADRRLIEYACLRANACGDDAGGGSDVVSVTVDDNGFSGHGGALSTTQTAPIVVVGGST